MNLHDVPAGPLRRCQITGSEDLSLIIDLGHQPPCDSLVEDVNAPETYYPLRLMLCAASGLAQLDYIVPGEEIYPPSYPYRSGISKPLEVYQRAFADGIAARRWHTMPNPLVVDIGSNDGTLLTGFKRNGYRALGVEPTDVASIAREENGIVTIQEFFSPSVAKDIVVDYGRASVVTMTNVFAHMADLGEVMDGLDILMARDGVFVTESHYLLDVLNKRQFDTIYHEHIRTYSLRSIVVLVEQYGMEVFDVERGDRYGGNIRAYIARRGTRPVSESVGRLLALEISSGLFDLGVWSEFGRDVIEGRDKFMEFLYAANRAGYSIGGNSAPGRASTLINYYGITKDVVPYLAELPTSLKLGKFLPGKHIPIIDNRWVVEAQPDYLILFAWHYAEPIIERLRSEGVKSKFVLPLPSLQVVNGD